MGVGPMLKPAAVMFLARAGLRDPVVISQTCGRQAAVLRLRGLGGPLQDRELALKIYRPEYQGNTTEAVSEEADALHRFGLTLKDREAGVTCPQVVASDPNAGLLLTEWCDGLPLSQATNASDWDSRKRDIARRLVSSIRLLHSELAVPYGDFHSENVLVAAEGLYLVDPTYAGRYPRRLESTARGLLAFDLGYWAYSAAARAPGRTARGQVAIAWREIMFTRSLIGAALETDPQPRELLVKIDSCARDAASGLSRSRLGVVLRYISATIRRCMICSMMPFTVR